MPVTPAAIVAVAENGVIGRDNGLPWHLPDDLRRFKAITTGHSILMGRRTYQSIGRALPGRRNVVLTRNPGWSAPGCETAVTPADALAATAGGELYVIGGAEVFAACWPFIRRLELTEVHADVPGDTVFAIPDPGAWLEVSRERRAADDRHAFDFSFVTLLRRDGRRAPPR